MTAECSDTWLVLGGARSGKSRRALELASSAARKVFIATADAGDAEMADRIALHQADRGAGWTTVEAPRALARAIAENDRADTAIVVDCLTLWLSNLMVAEDDVGAATAELVATLESAEGRIILVSNEIGFGLVPETALGRRFRDAQGRLNQEVAATVTHAELVVAGVPMTLVDRSGR